MKSIWKASGQPIFGERLMPDLLKMPHRKRRLALTSHSTSLTEPPEHDIGRGAPSMLLSSLLQCVKDKTERCVLHGDGVDMPSHLQDLLGCIQGEDVADAAGVRQVDIMMTVLLHHRLLAGGLVDDLPLLLEEEEPYIEAGPHWVEPGQEDGQVVQSMLKQLSSILGFWPQEKKRKEKKRKEKKRKEKKRKEKKRKEKKKRKVQMEGTYNN
ncbi:undifferentiated embryonic cell transcription factor 1-like [Limosa lapponica baueri]|uniref:Undifferentiated embryonic cell transcription factor 1-like n=1 Tax=Limosa lapponica baueri TaxID=1758121 RepID=A0A2I0TTB9_LIMLA|nr:undifferentiated embryonic cell transcription factor 1-like [Limosa lapponica baueri]